MKERIRTFIKVIKKFIRRFIMSKQEEKAESIELLNKLLPHRRLPLYRIELDPQGHIAYGYNRMGKLIYKWHVGDDDFIELLFQITTDIHLERS